ncbi:CoA ester lyase [uncultured Ezakiella sp.]|uniref:HpcH/HpaI aldolase/citrate lyase family protein n=1 Tax=uncultured Ezakiella sp. TaxID=1637529 RepID=UPI0025D36BEC|nr:CoA ester lyase [uncultured Ezakiella sp.]
MKYRTLLFIPGNNPGMLTSLEVLGADGYIIDLEDAVSLDNKDAARDLVRSFLKNKKGDQDIFVRINAPDTEFFEDDVKAMLDLDIKGLVLPKATISFVKELDAFLEGTDKKYFSIIETAISLETCFEIAREAKHMRGFLLGGEDMTLDLGVKRTKESKEIEYARQKVIAAAKANGIEAIDTPWTDTDDTDGLRTDALYAKALGMTGKALISPRHVDIVNEVFSPSKEDIEHAFRVFEALKTAKKEGKGAFSLDGKMVDKPVILRARDNLVASGNFKEEYNELI